MKNPKRILKLRVQGLVWCIKHPITLAVGHLPMNIIEKSEKLERIAEKCFDKPDSYLPKEYSAVNCIKCIIAGKDLSSLDGHTTMITVRRTYKARLTKRVLKRKNS